MVFHQLVFCAHHDHIVTDIEFDIGILQQITSHPQPHHQQDEYQPHHHHTAKNDIFFSGFIQNTQLELNLCIL